MKLAEWYLTRTKLMEPRNGREGYCLGNIRYDSLDAPIECYTVEDQDRYLELGNGKIDGRSAIPTGRYKLSLYQSPKRGDICILLHNVPAFSGVEIHAANYAEELRGCIAPGTVPTLDGVGNSRVALVGLKTRLRELIRGGFDVYLSIGRTYA